LSGRLLLLVSLAACSQMTSIPAGEASIEGRVTAVVRSGERIGSIRVETVPSDESGSPKAVARITQASVVRDASGEPADFNALAVGQWVRVWFTGPVAESYPVQANAQFVVVDSTSN
jgi:hypothetical protein